MDSEYLTLLFNFIQDNFDLLITTWFIFSFLVTILVFIYEDTLYQHKVDSESKNIEHHKKIIPKAILVTSGVSLLIGVLLLVTIKAIAFFYLL